MRKLLFAATAVASMAMTAPAFAATIYYQAGFSNSFYSYNTATNTETLIGSLGLNSDSTGLAFSNTGTLYAYERASRSLYTVNTATAATTLIGNTGLNAEDLTISLDGTVGYITSSGGLYSVNLATGAATLIGGGTTMDGLTTARGAVTVLGVNYAAGSLFGVDSGSIYAIDAATGAATFLGSSNGADETFDFGADGVLYGHGDDGFLYTIDLATLAGTQLAATTPDLVFGMAVQAAGNGAVPEPATWAMLIFGFGLVGGALRRSRKVRVALSYA